MKLWEVLKELDENPNKRFKSVNYNQEEIIISMGTGCYDLPFRVLDSNRDWQEIKQPVTWQEAIEAWANGKTIKCVHYGENYAFEGRSVFLATDEHVEPSNVEPSKKMILDGTWYIEED